MARKKTPLPEKPLCGSIEQNKIIDAVNKGKPNPCTENAECIRFYNGVKAEKDEHPDRYFSFVETDYYEEVLLSRLLK